MGVAPVQLPIYLEKAYLQIGCYLQMGVATCWMLLADDTILFMDHDLEKAHNLKLILVAFEQLSGLKINFHKSELFCFGDAQDDTALYTELFGCGQGQFPIRYLGIPIH
jgi:hypothetical protein